MVVAAAPAHRAATNADTSAADVATAATRDTAVDAASTVASADTVAALEAADAAKYKCTEPQELH